MENKCRLQRTTTGRPSVLLLFIILPCLVNRDVLAGADVEFNPVFLQHIPGENIIDVKRFSHGQPVPPGEYYSDIWLNGEWKGRAVLRFNLSSGMDRTLLCLTPELLSLLDLNEEALSDRIIKNSSGCTDISSVIPVSRIRFEPSELRLNIDIPQALLIHRPRGYISPAQWQTGVPATFVNYNLNNYRYRVAGTQEDRTYLGIRAGFNFAGFALRHRGNWSGGRTGGYRSTETNLRHDVAALRGQLTVGDFSTGGELMENVSLRGVRLASDDRMLPGSLRGYAPVVHGIASSNAKVTIRQNGNIIYETTVPAGPFTVNDLYPSGYGGDLTVSVTEANGQTRLFTVPFASVAQLVRPGYTRYQVSTGRYRYADNNLDEIVFQGTLQYGLVNDVTVNSGVMATPHYIAALAGAAFNTPFGAIASDITFSETKLSRNDRTQKGYSLHASYNVSMPLTNTSLTLAAYRYMSKDFYNLRDAMWANRVDYFENSQARNSMFFRPRNQFQLSVNQELGAGRGNLYLTGSTYSYWSRKGTRSEYQAGYSNVYRRLNYQVGYSRSFDTDNLRDDRRIYVNFSIPLGESQQSPLLSTTLNGSKGAGNSLQTSVSGVAGEDNQFSYGLSASAMEKGGSGYSASTGYRSPYAYLTATAGNDSLNNRQTSLGVSGAVVAHPFGITLSNDLSDTFAIIHAEGAGGATINNSPGNRLDPWGNGIVPSVTPYEKNAVSIDPEALPMNVELSATEQEIIPRANSATLVNFTTQSGEAMLFDIRMSDGSIPPMASEAFDAQGKSIGYVVQGGRLFARGLKDKGTVKVIWGRYAADHCIFSYHSVVKRQTDKPVVTILPVRCMKPQKQ
ncbi:fimbrial biogenesis outer membrane usher protein [Salmonella enterica]|nr:fimbrial biogenesis outer membrane usher protein [Salmonella enterica]ECI4529952.1 fimbrial biogenesis outer membrane usher protein [Salmonella enterica subsp. diarizonae]EBJ7484120.1 fimbrial biogenesis outer membrane usher protein [Salmonella enterica]EDJ7305021.1 fimbrial biogenesis outer membrane usher protein [Salmonella enterica]EDS7006125.1 fimbrial biogenesis outer membrane usher protein [Salmonella enterica subsp. diarizonae]